MQKMPGRNGGTLNRLEKGETANPKGRVKKLPELDVLLADVLGSKDENGDQSEAKAVLLSLLKQAKKGNVNAATAILNRAYGMPLQKTENKNINETVTGETLTPEQVQRIEQIAQQVTDNGNQTVPGK